MTGAIAAGAPAAGAQASTIHACVKPKSGATRIVSAKAKCRHGEKKLSWSTTGPQGERGPAGGQGVPGAAGANGTGPAFLAGTATPAKIAEEPKVLVEKTIPPGDYVITAPLLLGASATAAKKLVAVQCFAVDNPGTSLTDSDLGSKSTQIGAFGQWKVPLAEESATEFGASMTLTLAGAIESKVTSTMGVACEDEDSSPGVTVESVFDDLIAVQVSSLTT